MRWSVPRLHGLIFRQIPIVSVWSSKKADFDNIPKPQNYYLGPGKALLIIKMTFGSGGMHHSAMCPIISAAAVNSKMTFMWSRDNTNKGEGTHLDQTPQVSSVAGNKKEIARLQNRRQQSLE